MKVMCAWCGQQLPDKRPFKDKRTTHGICDACYKAKIKGMNRDRRRDWAGIFWRILVLWFAFLIIIQTVMWLKR